MARALLCVALLLASSVPALTASGADGFERFRIVTTGDAYATALSSTCPHTYESPRLPDDPSATDCWLLKTNLGYDGATGARTWAVETHLGHPFTCAVVSSATSPVGDALPFPVNMAVSDSIVVSFVSNGEFGASSYGGRLMRPFQGEVARRIVESVEEQDLTALAGTPEWFMENHVHGATPVVSGTVDAEEMRILNEGGTDVTVECTF